MRAHASILTTLVATAVAAATGHLLYQNDFESGLGDWDMTDAKAWELQETEHGKSLALVRPSFYMPKVRSPQNIAWIAGLEADSFVLEADLKQTGREYGHRDLCLFFGRQDAEHFYYVHLASVADEHANSVFVVDGEPRRSIAESRTDGTDWGNSWHHVMLVRDTESGAIEVFFDDMDTPAMRAVDKTFGKGGIGVGSFDDVGLFDNIQVRPLREP